MVIKYILALLQTEKEVIVEGLGSFKSEYKGAAIHPVDHKINPPDLEITYHPDKNSDLVLEKYIAHQKDISLETAKQEVQDFVSSILSRLKNGESVELEGLGELKMLGDNVIFEQTKGAVLDKSFGLPYVSLKKEGDIPQKEDKSALQKPEKTEKTIAPTPIKEKKKSKKRKTSWGALIAVLSITAILVYAFYIIIVAPEKNPFRNMFQDNDQKAKTDTTTQTVDSLSLSEDVISEDSLADGTWSENETLNEDEVDEQLTEELQSEDVALDDTKTINSNKIEDYIIYETTGKYYVIVGSFGSKENALKLGKELLNANVEQVRIIAPSVTNRLYRVTYSIFNDEFHAESRAKSLDNQYPGAWVLKY